MRNSGRSNHVFSQVPSADIPRARFSRSHSHKTTFNAGYLIPFYVDEALPGDTFRCNVNVFARLATPIVPLMDNMYLDIFFFAVPNRLVWDNWQKFCGERINPEDSTDYLIPVVNSGAGFSAANSDPADGSKGLFDYMGIPPGIPLLSVSALYSRAYNLIWNEWFRDENLQNTAVVDKGNGPDAAASYVLKRRGKRHDYFTSALPWPQKGPGVTLPLAGYANVIPLAGGSSPTFSGGGASSWGPAIHALTAESGGSVTSGEYATGGYRMNSANAFATPGDAVLNWNAPNLRADLGTSSAITINSMRESFQIQRLLERDARGGTRYTEIVRAHFKVNSPDARLQRPEYLGGGSVPVVVNPVSQTSQTGVTPLGFLGGFGHAGGSRNGFNKSFVEHSVILGLIMCRADVSYQQGIARHFSRRTRYDFYWPALSHLGEQAIKMKEIFATGVPAEDDAVFGYQERYAEYRYFPNMITGKWRSTAVTALDVWHLGQRFSTAPGLNDVFIQENPPISRVVAVPSEPQFLFDSFFEIMCARPMPLYGVPGNVDRF